ncbi:MAG: hypothetical protein P4L70_01685 [Parasulfuritortus sp.]|nr:hypothetical protein [Parasulfuritortus sp.]
MNFRTSALALIALGLAAGCQSAPTRSDVFGLSALQLNQTLTIPAGAATVRLQNGQTIATNAVQEFDPYCVFELETVSEAPQSVQPGRFTITSIERRVQDFSGMPVVPNAGVLGPYGDDGPSQVYYVTLFHLKSDADRRVRSLRCESNQVSIPGPSQRYLSLHEMQGAVGDYFSFELPR